MFSITLMHVSCKLLESSLSSQVLKVADFGLSIDVGQERPVTRAGTLDYMV